ncbi:MAG: lycopene cyclase family protein, partial [Nannocystaceae bacterium]
MDADVIVAGAGCAGLSLALRIRRLRPDVHIILVDRDHGGHPHKLWSFWSEDPQAMLPLDVPFTSWSTMHAAGPGWSRTKSLRALRYCTVDSEQFEDRAREELRASPGVEFRTGDVKAVTSSYRGARVQLDTHTIRAPYAFQSCLPPSVSAPRYPIWQHFAGVVLRSEAPRFDPSRFTLMDFDVE